MWVHLAQFSGWKQKIVETTTRSSNISHINIMLTPISSIFITALRRSSKCFAQVWTCTCFLEKFTWKPEKVKSYRRGDSYRLLFWKSLKIILFYGLSSYNYPKFQTFLFLRNSSSCLFSLKSVFLAKRCAIFLETVMYVKNPGQTIRKPQGCNLYDKSTREPLVVLRCSGTRPNVVPVPHEFQKGSSTHKSWNSKSNNWWWD